MCHTRCITYACQHTFPIRLSTCRGTFTVQARKTKAPRAACNSAPSLVVRSAQACGPCQRAAIEAALAGRILAIRAANPGSWLSIPELVEAEAEWETQSFWLTRRFPERRFEKAARPEQGVQMTPTKNVGPSLLRQEVQPEDILEIAIDWVGWATDWGEGWKTMEEELAEQEAEKPEDVKVCEAMAARELMAWTEGLPGPDFGENAEANGWAELAATVSRDSTATATAEKTTVINVEELSEDIASSLSSFRATEQVDLAACVAEMTTSNDIEQLPNNITGVLSENLNPTARRIPEAQRPPKGTSTRRKAQSDSSDTENKWACFPSWLTVIA